MSKEEDEKGSKEFAERQGYMDGMLIRKKGKVVYVHHTEPDHNPTELEQKTEDQNRNANEESSGMDK